MQYDLLIETPYQLTSDDIIFNIFAERKKFKPTEYVEKRAQFFSKGQPCFRTSPLAKI